MFLLQKDLKRLLNYFTAACKFLWIDRKCLEKHFKYIDNFEYLPTTAVSVMPFKRAAK